MKHDPVCSDVLLTAKCTASPIFLSWNETMFWRYYHNIVQKHLLYTTQKQNRIPNKTCNMSYSSANAFKTTMTEEIFGRLTVVSPAPTDIVFGRGGKANRHVGNDTYRELLKVYESAYRNCRRKYQKLLSLCIIHQCRIKVRKARRSWFL